MELVYLWVEEYKNIYHQGFNFSPRFECKYDENTNELTIDENKEFVSIFPDNINITAIVGENGSGKTSLIDFIHTSINVKNKKKFLFLFSDNNQKYYISNLNLSKINVTLLNQFNFNKYDFTIPKNIIINTKSYDMNSTLKFFISIFDKVEKNLFFNPNSILINENQEKKIKIISELLENIKEKENLEEELSKINIYTLDVINKFFNNEEYIDFLCDKYEYTGDIDEFYDENERKTLRKTLKANKFYKDFLHYLLNLLIALNNNLLQKPINPFTKYIQNKAVSYLFRNIQKVNSIVDFLHELSESEFISPIDFDEEEELGKNKTFGEDCSDYLDVEKYFDKKIELSKIKIHKVQKFKELLSFNFFDDKDVSFNDFSEGEKNLFLSTLEIYFQFLKENKIILLDEIELFLHPQWQKQYINNLLKLFEFNNVHFIFVTHSPFILSDLPKENIIFLEQYKKDEDKNQKEGNCKIANPDINQTFGANIHTLLSHGFFMENGLMGEFAKSKIRTIQITYKYILHRHKQKSLNKKEHKKSRRFVKIQLKKLWYIQSIIGEKFLQTIMKNYLQEIEKILFGNEKAIDNEIERLENLKKSIKNAKN